MNWISVKDRLPEPWDEVLIFYKDKNTGSFGFAMVVLVPGESGSYWSADKFYVDLTDESVTHWTCLVGPNGERDA
jgi:hypothetical protein